MKIKNIDINSQFQKALDLMADTGKSVFITGKAGTGKSTLLDYYRRTAQKKLVVLAPTGVAALNVFGETIHSFFKFKPNITLRKVKKLSTEKSKIYKSLDSIIIDEVSMLRADLLDCIDKFLRLNGKHSKQTFGGLQMIFIGDLYQLPPVVIGREKEIFKKQYNNAYFFEANALKDFPFEFVELETVYRQKDENFIELLNAIRNNSVTEEHFSMLNKRANIDLPSENSGFCICLTTTNKTAAEINKQRLDELKAKIYSYPADIMGDFQENSYPADNELNISINSQVMLLNNDTRGRWVNGSIGSLKKIKYDEEKETDVIYVEFPGGDIEEVLPVTWEIFHFAYNEKNNEITTENVGSFSQYPLKLAWAVTIHKSQGKTFDKVIIDMGKGAFACGQTYVALSRCTSFDGIFLKKPIKKSDIRMDFNIVRFLTGCQYSLSERDMPLEEKMELISHAIKEKLSLEITYLKANDTKSRRVIKPFFVGERVYQDKTFTGVEAYCDKRSENRVFRVDRILEMKII
ncbi:MAG: AAA family ATPase [Candidatus Omnitrophota bacterium]